MILLVGKHDIVAGNIALKRHVVDVVGRGEGGIDGIEIILRLLVIPIQQGRRRPLAIGESEEGLLDSAVGTKVGSAVLGQTEKGETVAIGERGRQPIIGRRCGRGAVGSRWAGDSAIGWC